MNRPKISFSGGVESTTMCLLYGKGADAIVCDTGDEEPEMYERWDFVEQSMKVMHGGDFNLIRIKPTVVAKGIECHTLNQLALAWGFWPTSGSRYCTGKLKIEPVDNHLSNLGEVVLMIGLNSDEESSREGNWELLNNVTYTYPLADNGYNRNDCIELLTKFGLEPHFPPYMQRGGCRKCFFRSKKEAKAKYFFNKTGFLEDMDFEIKFNEVGTRKLTKAGKKKYFGINQAFPQGYPSLVEECEQEIAMFGLQAIKEMYKDIQSHKTCGVFCHR